MKAIILTDYQNYKGGINNLQCASVFVNGTMVKWFSSTNMKANRYAEIWAKRNGYSL